MNDSRKPASSLRAARGDNLPWRSLIFQLVTVIILPLTVLVLAVTFGSIALHQNAMRTLVGERDQRAVLASASALGDQFEQRLAAARGLAIRAAPSSTGDLAEMLSTADFLQSDFDAGLAFFTLDGALLASTGDRTFWDPFSSAVPGMLSRLADDAQAGFVSETFPAPATSDRLGLVIARVPERDWVVLGAFSTQTLIHHALAKAFPADQHVSAIVVDANNHLLYRSGTYDFGDGTRHPGVPEALRGESGAMYRKVEEAEGRYAEHVVAYSPVEPAGWALVIAEPWEMVATPALLTTQVAPLVLVPVLLLALLALWFGLRQVVQPLQVLEAQSADLAWGNYQAIEKPVGGIAEIRNLQAGLIHMARKVQAAQQSLHGYIGAITAGQEEERRRLARELHDDTIQSLIALKQRVQLAHMTPNGPPGEPFPELEALAESTIENLRRLTRALRPIYLEDLGLAAALEMLAGETGKIAGYPIEFQRRGVERRLKPELELALYRVVQEGLSNITRHAEASQTSVSIVFTPEEIRLEVCDNGKGFVVPKNPAEMAPSGHYGLLGLHERAELIGASLSIQSAPDHGTCLTIRLPVKENV